MNTSNWIVDAIGSDRYFETLTEASRRRLNAALEIAGSTTITDEKILPVFHALELGVFDLLDNETVTNELRAAAEVAFRVGRILPVPEDPVQSGMWLVRIGCLAILGDRGADIRRILMNDGFPELPISGPDWGTRVHASILDVWLRLFRKDGWKDLDEIQIRVADLRTTQTSFEPQYLEVAMQQKDVNTAWTLITMYHLAKAAEILAVFLSQGSSDGHFDIRQQLEAQFDRAKSATSRGRLLELATIVELLSKTSYILVDNSIWSVTRAVNSRVTKFVRDLVDRSHDKPIFEMLPPQRITLREEGLLGSSHRSVVISLPTSSGKTFIAQFQILQALNQFDQDRGWVAYLAPTRALVNQLTVRLRSDFSPLGIQVEKASPALEVDGLEAAVLIDQDLSSQFRVLVTTPEKFDMMIRGGWEEKIGRPLTLVVVDEAHNLSIGERGLKLELLLATINRECRHSQFLLLTPFIKNAEEIAKWLAPERYKNIELSVDWSPNDRAIITGQPIKGSTRGGFSLQLKTIHTSRANFLDTPEKIELPDQQIANLKWSDVNQSPGKLAAAIAGVLEKRGTVIILADKPKNTWGIASACKTEISSSSGIGVEVENVKAFLAHEMGKDFPLCELLDYGIAVHHSGISDDARALIEWLTEHGKLKVLVATTTIAQGVNFPVSGIVFASHQYPYGQVMPPEDFWNIAGRAGRVNQNDLGIVALAATDTKKKIELEAFVNRNVSDLNSTLIAMVRSAMEEGVRLDLSSLYWKTEWSSFLQYLAHTYLQIGDHERFAAEVEQVLRGTLGFQALRKNYSTWASGLVASVYDYAQQIKGKPLKLVDATGFSWESVSHTLWRLAEDKIDQDVWKSDMFTSNREPLRKMMGILLNVPELRKNLKEVTGGRSPDGDMLSRMVCDWVQGRTLDDMAKEYFHTGGIETSVSVDAMTKCCRNIFSRLTQTASWGLSALQSLTIKDELEKLSPVEQRTFRNLPSRVYYGVNSNEAIALRLIGVPRLAAQPLVNKLDVTSDEPISKLRARLRGGGLGVWQDAMGSIGSAYHHAWKIIEGEA